ncbi:MAG: metallophosphoesterase [Candidatus Micrarchaeia archaeon]
MDFGRNEIRLIYGKPALVIAVRGTKYLVVGDLHIGIELELARKGIMVYDATERLARSIKKIMHEFSIRKLVLLGDVKNSIMWPPKAELSMLKSFFQEINDFEVYTIAGNHDAHLGEVVGADIRKELIIGNIALAHGHAMPSEQAMECDYLITAHNHIAIAEKGKGGAFKEEKAWLIASPSSKNASKHYAHFNKGIRLIVMPAFNELITGTPVNSLKKDKMGALFSSGLFTMRGAKVYTLWGTELAFGAIPKV